MSTEMKTLRGRGCACPRIGTRTRAARKRRVMAAHCTREAGASRGLATPALAPLVLRPIALLAAEQRLLPRGAPAVAAGPAGGWHDAMTRDRERHRIGGARARDGPHGAGLPNRPRD